MVRATFRYEPSEIENIEEELGPGALTSPEFTVTIGYRADRRSIGHAYDEAKIVTHFTADLDLPQSATAAVTAARTVPELLTALDGVEQLPTDGKALVEWIRGWRDQSIGGYLIDKFAVPLMPKFVYYGDYDVMPGKVSIPDLINRRAGGGKIERGEQALLSLLDLAEVKLDDFQHTDRHERVIRELENTSNVISEEVFEYWSQNTDLEIDLKVLPVEQGAATPMDQGPILQIRVRNQRHKVSVPFDDRSRGFVWFFSFLAYFNKLEPRRTTTSSCCWTSPGCPCTGARRKTCSGSSTSGSPTSTRSSTPRTRRSWSPRSTWTGSGRSSTTTRRARRSPRTCCAPTATPCSRCWPRWASR